ncbi:uncharacterized protein CLUP02_15064 [Colletotrichum lupini]|uniref:Uncharacterized protein n=1 Tax=Colletotrichum lupini TaxID=145971 RepID=A0A9Q8T5D4_9PEZI|nr:uncharacterized protein CLUP02_15064 [Colletotrichum lupini]UQC89533.1 hypothetical protein CLUP02_15064 [Colletotrichum lupini]
MRANSPFGHFGQTATADAESPTLLRGGGAWLIPALFAGLSSAEVGLVLGASFGSRTSEPLRQVCSGVMRSEMYTCI